MGSRCLIIPMYAGPRHRPSPITQPSLCHYNMTAARQQVTERICPDCAFYLAKLQLGYKVSTVHTGYSLGSPPKRPWLPLKSMEDLTAGPCCSSCVYWSMLAARDWVSPQMLHVLSSPCLACRPLSVLNMLKLSPTPCYQTMPVSPCQAGSAHDACLSNKAQTGQRLQAAYLKMWLPMADL